VSVRYDGRVAIDRFSAVIGAGRVTVLAGSSGSGKSSLLAALGRLDPQAPATVTGSGLSGGQAERVVAARAIYRGVARHCPVLVFDEPSAALDSEAEADLLRGLRHLADEGYTILIVSHRPEVIAAADDLIELGVAAHV